MRLKAKGFFINSKQSTVIHGSLDHSNFVDLRELVIADIEIF